MNCSKFEEGGSDERMDATHMSVFHSASNRSRGKRSSFPQLGTLSTCFFTRETV